MLCDLMWCHVMWCVRVYVYVYVYINKCICICICLRICICMFMFMFMRMYVCLHACMYVCMCMYMYMYMCIYIYLFIFIVIYIYIHTFSCLVDVKRSFIHHLNRSSIDMNPATLKAGRNPSINRLLFWWWHPHSSQACRSSQWCLPTFTLHSPFTTSPPFLEMKLNMAFLFAL